MRYVKAGSFERGRLLDKMEVVTRLHRKRLIRLVSNDLKRKPDVSTTVVSMALKSTMRCASSPRLSITSAQTVSNPSWYGWLPAWRTTANWKSHGTFWISSATSATSTIKGTLKRMRQDKPRLPRRRPCRGNKVPRDIPMKPISWNEQQTELFEVGVVRQCDARASGQYVHTIQMIDVATGWSKRVARLVCSHVITEDGFCPLLAPVPFPIVQLHSDNESQFFNENLVRLCKDPIEDLQLSRSGPNQKNENPFIEQNQSTLLRAPLGYAGFHTAAERIAINQLCDMMWLLYNSFQPVMRVREKIIVSADGQSARVKRRYDQARSPLDRLCETNAIPKERKETLLSLRDQVNPRKLRQDIYDQTDCIFSLPGPRRRVTEDFCQTLSQPIQIRK